MFSFLIHRSSCLSRSTRRLRLVAFAVFIVFFIIFFFLTIHRPSSIAKDPKPVNLKPVPNVVHFVHFINKEDGKHQADSEELVNQCLGKIYTIQAIYINLLTDHATTHSPNHLFVSETNIGHQDVLLKRIRYRSDSNYRTMLCTSFLANVIIC